MNEEEIIEMTVQFIESSLGQPYFFVLAPYYEKTLTNWYGVCTKKYGGRTFFSNLFRVFYLRIVLEP